MDPENTQAWHDSLESLMLNAVDEIERARLNPKIGYGPNGTLDQVLWNFLFLVVLLILLRNVVAFSEALSLISFDQRQYLCTHLVQLEHGGNKCV